MASFGKCMVLLSLLVPVALVLRALLLPEFVELAPVVASPAGSVQGMVMTLSMHATLVVP